MKKIKGYKKLRGFLGIVLILAMLFESVAAHSFLAEAAEKETGNEETGTEAAVVSENRTAEDLTVVSDYVLQENMVVKNLVLNGRTLDLNGYQMEVLGSITQTGGEIKFNKGEILCEGDYTLNGYGCLRMLNGNDYMKVNGDFTYRSQSNSNSMSAGVIEIGGDFFQKQDEAWLANEGFVPTGTHQVIFSGNKRQAIHFDSPASYFNKVVLRNTSEEGIYSDSLINALSMERNGTEITTDVIGRYGWKLTEDEVYEGDLVLIGDTLDLNGHSLQVTGNLLHMNGRINLNGGSLTVEKDFRLQRESEQKGEFSGAPVILSMLDTEDKVTVGGDFVTESTVSHSTYLQNGILDVKGNVEQKKYCKEDNLAMTSEFTLRLSGNEVQGISMESARQSCSGLANFEVANPAGVELGTDLYVTGNVSEHGNPITGHSLVIESETTFDKGSFSGNIIINSNFTLKNLSQIGGNLTNNGAVTLRTDLTVGGSFHTKYRFSLGGHHFQVMGDAKIARELNIDGGSFICDGDFELTNDASYASSLVMQDEEDYVLVKGDFYANSAYGANSTKAGILELKGDFKHTSPGNKGNFCASGTHVTVFSGTSKQTVTFADEYSYFNQVEIENTSEQGIYAPNGINCNILNRNGNKVTTDKEGESGWRLTGDQTYDGALYLISDELDLNGHTLRVRGNLIQSAGTVTINGGQLVVEGDYRIQSETKTDSTKIYNQSMGYLQMTNEDDRVTVEGDFVMGSLYSHNGKLTAGELTVKGDVRAVTYKAEDNFVTTDTHVLLLGGSQVQKVNLAEPSFSKMRIANIKFVNTSEEGVVLEKNLPVTGNVSGNGNRITGFLLATATTLFEDGEYSGDVLTEPGKKIGNLSVLNGNLVTRGNVSLQNGLVVNGDLSVESGYLDLKGNELKVTGDITINSAYIRISKGKCICGGDMTLKYLYNNQSYLMMNDAEDYVCVDGDFYARSRAMSSAAMTTGTLELKGNFEHERTMNDDGFVVTGDCKVILSGDKLQTVNFDSTGSYFAFVEIQNTSAEGVYSEEGIHCKYLETNGNVYRTKKEGNCGWKLEEDQTWEGDLVLATGTLDLQGHELTSTEISSRREEM